MKHNAAGLASICILSTAVILLLVCSTSLMMLGEQNIDSMFPKDVMVRGVVNENCSLSDADNAVDEVLKTVGITAQDRSSVSFYMGVCDVADDGLSVHPNDSVDFTKLRSIYVVTAEQYELYTGKQASLAPGEIYRYSSADDVKDGDKIKIFGNEYSVKKSIDESGLEEFFDSSMSLFSKASDNSSRSSIFILPSGYIITSARRSITVIELESVSRSKVIISRYQHRRELSALRNLLSL